MIERFLVLPHRAVREAYAAEQGGFAQPIPRGLHYGQGLAVMLKRLLVLIEPSVYVAEPVERVSPARVLARLLHKRDCLVILREHFP
jgi:hypothetical protein